MSVEPVEPVVPVDRLRNRLQRFKCEPYSATIRAAVCVDRQHAQANANSLPPTAERPHYEKCLQCGLGARVRAALEAPATTKQPVASETPPAAATTDAPMGDAASTDDANTASDDAGLRGVALFQEALAIAGSVVTLANALAIPVATVKTWRRVGVSHQRAALVRAYVKSGGVAVAVAGTTTPTRTEPKGVALYDAALQRFGTLSALSAALKKHSSFCYQWRRASGGYVPPGWQPAVESLLNGSGSAVEESPAAETRSNAVPQSDERPTVAAPGPASSRSTLTIDDLDAMALAIEGDATLPTEAVHLVRTVGGTMPDGCESTCHVQQIVVGLRVLAARRARRLAGAR